MRLGITLIIFLIISAFTPLASAGEWADTFEKKLNVNGDQVTIHISSSSFSPESSNIDLSKPWKMKGKEPLGGFPGRPSTVIGRFHVIWAGNHYHVPVEYYEDCFDPYFRSKMGWWDNQGGILVRESDNGKAVLIEMETSQNACCGYSVIWVIDNRGGIARFIDNSIP